MEMCQASDIVCSLFSVVVKGAFMSSSKFRHGSCYDPAMCYECSGSKAVGVMKLELNATEMSDGFCLGRSRLDRTC